MSSASAPKALRRAWTRLRGFIMGEPVAPGPIQLASFTSQKQLNRWAVNTDAPFGGGSHAQIQLDESGQFAVFSGEYNKQIMDGSELVRAGFVSVTTLLPRNVNLSNHDYLEFRVRAHTPHTYMASVRAEQLTAANAEEAWQAAVRPAQVGEWESIRVPLDELRFTFRGRMSSKHQLLMSRRERTKVVGLGLILAATEDMPARGHFRLDLQSISAGVEELTGIAALAKHQQVELSAAQLEALEGERRMLEAAKQLDCPGASHRHD